jgi:ribonuclease G
VEKELIINSSPTEVEIALLEEGKLVEIHRQKNNNKFTVGDIFLGGVKRLMPGLNAAFIEIGHPKDAFLHYTDLGPKLRSLLKFTNGAIHKSLNTHQLDNFKIEPEIIKTGKVNEVLKKKQPLLVQVLKEPISTKGPRLSCEITIPGRNLVMTPFNNIIAVSKKISSADERKRLQNLVESIRPKNFGFIVRTAAEGKKVADLHEEIGDLMSKWESIFAQLQNSRPPEKLLSELDRASTILRDMLNDSFTKIVVNNKDLYDSVKSFIADVFPKLKKIVKLHKDGKHIFDAYGISKQIKSSFGKTSTMPSGAYIVIEHTEAMHVIDVNSGPKAQKMDQETASIKVNLEASREIARQLRLRDIGGIILIDFIDMKSRDNRTMLLRSMKEYMKNDHAQHTILPLSKFGLMQITRQRVKPEVKINTAETCPTCKGSGNVTPTFLVTDDIRRDLNFIIQSRPHSKLKLSVHPFLYSYLKKGFMNYQKKWYFELKKWVTILENQDLHLTEYKFYDGNNDEIRFN